VTVYVICETWLSASQTAPQIYSQQHRLVAFFIMRAKQDGHGAVRFDDIPQGFHRGSYNQCQRKSECEAAPLGANPWPFPQRRGGDEIKGLREN
jgi:hypothetical protein